MERDRYADNYTPLTDLSTKERDEVNTILVQPAESTTVVDVWGPDSGDKAEVNEMIDLLRANNVEVNLIPIRSLYQAELHVGFEEYVGVNGVKKYLDERRQA